MDQNLVDLLKAAEVISPNQKEAKMKIGRDGVVEVETPDGPKKATLKPLAELYGPGRNADVDPESDAFMPLFMAIEGAIVKEWRFAPALTDAQVASTLDRLGLKPESAPGADELAASLLLELRLLLSLNNYSRQEVRTAIRRVSRSVARHTQVGGPRGYLEFIRKYIPG